MKLKKPSCDSIRHAIDHQRKFAETRLCAYGRLHLAGQTTHPYSELMLPRRDRRVRSHNHMLASDIHVVHKVTGLQIQAVAGRRIAMGYQDTFTRFVGASISLDQIAATTNVWCYVCWQVPHSGMEHVTLAGGVEAVGIHYEALA